MKKRGVIGVDVGGTSVSVGIITETAEVIEVIKYAQVHTKSSIWTEKLIEKIEELRQKNYQDFHFSCCLQFSSSILLYRE